MKLNEVVLQGKVLGIGGEVHLARPDDTGGEGGLGRLVKELGDRDSGLVVVVDEAHSAKAEDFAWLAATVQEAVVLQASMVTVIGGLPGLRRRPSESDQSLGYLERANWFELDVLDEAGTHEALAGAARLAGRPMAPAAVDVLGRASGGYPYAVQVLGKHAWRASNGTAMITASHAAAALGPADAELGRNLYGARWGQASPGARAYILAVARLTERGERVTARAVADHLGREPRALSVTRARLIERGTLIVDGNEMRFMVPGFGAWAQRQRPDPVRGRPAGGGRRPEIER